MQTLKIKKLSDLAKIPQRATDGSAGYDLFAANLNEICIKPNLTQKVPTGIAIELWDNTVCALVYARSSLACKHAITPANCVGVIDSDYRGEIIVFLTNNGSENYLIKSGDRIAQMLISPVIVPQIKICDELNDTQRSEGGFGSTGR